jgi:SNF2 family DNA or RNA helicase
MPPPPSSRAQPTVAVLRSRRADADIVVLDEAQRIKNWATKTALTVKRLAPPYRLVLTGTPMENRLDELASIVEWVDDLALEPKWRLAAWHTTPVDGRAEINGARNLDTLRTRLATCMVRRSRREVLSQLPARTDTRIPIDMTAEQIRGFIRGARVTAGDCRKSGCAVGPSRAMRRGIAILTATV